MNENAPTKTLQIPMAFERALEELSIGEEAATALRSRLQPILAPTPPSIVEKIVAGDMREEQPQIAEQFNTLADRARGIRDIIDSILDRAQI